jgi:hypothetical protein
LEDGPHKKRRSARVILAIPLTLVTKTAQGETIQADAVTVAVNAHGGLLKVRVRAELLLGQPLTLINPKSGAEEECRTVRAECLSKGEFAVAFEFDRPSPEFWPVSFPPTDWVLAPANSR